jgi:NodT family efflux transporter outer membrane factor (OMF) lipoprotein
MSCRLPIDKAMEPRMNADERRWFVTRIRSFTMGTTLSLAKLICVHLRSSAVPLLFVLAGCAVGPNYSKPAIETPPAYKEMQGWTLAHPRDAAPKGRWWEAFDDPVLDGLVEKVSVSNQTLKAAEARYTQARASVQAARAGLFPTVGASGRATRSGAGQGGAANRYNVALDASWEIDLWGRVRRLIEANQAGAEASAADLEAVRLSLQSELALDYFQLRVTDAQRILQENIVKALQSQLDMTQNRYRAGVVGKVDSVQAEAQLRSNEAQAIDLRATRASLEHAIAVLIGQPPALFTLEPANIRLQLPAIPPGLPSTLLERRPDVAAAERRVAQANAEVGVAQAAYFPTLSLTGSGGFASSALSSLFSAPSRVWSLGAGLAGTILDFGLRGAQVEQARAAYDETVANYRETVLVGFQEVEDNLATVRWLAEEDKVQQEALRLARETVQLTTNQYKAGTVGYLNVVVVQAAQFSEERSAVAILGRRLAATVGLIRALGGTWETQT